MPSIRRSGGAVAYFWQGKLPDPADPAFAEALLQHRFRTIEDAASEEVSVGWVSAGDPTGDSFESEHLDAGNATWLRLRLDKKQLPRKWLQIHRDVAEKAKGKKLSAKERRELKDDLMDKLLPRVLPAVNFVDALIYAERKTVLLLNTSKSVGESFTKLFFQTFGLALETSDPLRLGLQCSLDPEAAHRLSRVEPVRWPRQGNDETPARRSAVVAVEEEHA